MTIPRCCSYFIMIRMLTGRGQDIFKDSCYPFDESAASSSSSEEDEMGVAVDTAADGSSAKGGVAGTPSANATDGAATAVVQPAEGEEASNPNSAAADAPFPCPPAVTPDLPTMAAVSSLVGAASGAEVPPPGTASVSASQSSTPTSERTSVVA